MHKTLTIAALALSALVGCASAPQQTATAEPAIATLTCAQLSAKRLDIAQARSEIRWMSTTYAAIPVFGYVAIAASNSANTAKDSALVVQNQRVQEAERLAKCSR